MQGHGTVSPAQKGLAGFQGRCEIEGVQKTLHGLIGVDQVVPFVLP